MEHPEEMSTKLLCVLFLDLQPRTLTALCVTAHRTPSRANILNLGNALMSDLTWERLNGQESGHQRFHECKVEQAEIMRVSRLMDR